MGFLVLRQEKFGKIGKIKKIKPFFAKVLGILEKNHEIISIIF